MFSDFPIIKKILHSGDKVFKRVEECFAVIMTMLVKKINITNFLLKFLGILPKKKYLFC